LATLFHFLQKGATFNSSGSAMGPPPTKNIQGNDMPIKSTIDGSIYTELYGKINFDTAALSR
jgi:hypothetical protein